MTLVGDDRETFIGREDELRLIGALSDRALGGLGSFVLVIGDPGIGKTRLCEQAAESAAGAGLRVVFGRCWADSGAPPMWPWQSVLRDVGCEGFGEDEPSDAVQVRFLYFENAFRQLAAACRRQPAMVVLDDLHNGDESALVFTRYVARSLRTVPLILVGVRRTHEPLGVASTYDLHTALQAETDGTLIELGGLTVDNISRMAKVFHVSTGATGEVLHVATGGNPLHARHVLGLLPSSGDLTDSVLGGGLTAALRPSIARLSTGDRHVLGCAAVLGTSASLTDVAQIAATSAKHVREVVRDARRRGVLASTDDSFCRFSHDLVRDTVVASLDQEVVLDIRRRSAHMLLAARDESRVTRCAHHALAAGRSSPDDALVAIDASRAAAKVLIAGYAYEDAAALLSRAVDVHREVGVAEPVARLYVEWAEALMCSGRLTDAHQCFDLAARMAESENDLAALGEAAVGLGGIWPNEIREFEERQRILSRQRRALAALPADHESLRIRLRARLAAEACYWEHRPDDQLQQVVEDARQLDDPQALCQALALLHGALWAPDHAVSRLAVAEEMTAVSVAAGDATMTLVGLLYRAVDLFLLGDPVAERALAEARSRADITRCLAVSYLVECLDLMLVIRAGHLAKAETTAERVLTLGVEAGDCDAMTYYGGHLLAIRWFQGHEAETYPVFSAMLDSPDLADVDHTVDAAVAALAAQAGLGVEARRALDRFTAEGLGELPRFSTWLATLMGAVEAASFLGDVALAREAYDLMLPFRSHPVMPSFAVVCFGSAQRSLGLAARTVGELDIAVDHFLGAIADNDRLGNRPFAAICEQELALTLHARGKSGDDAAATAAIERAITPS